jgi:hypothetical protein
VLVALTAAGEAALATQRVFHGSALARAARELPEDERAALIAGLAALVGLARRCESERADG